LDGAGDGRPVIIVGTGLTMLDLATTVTDANPAPVVHAVSRHALLPREHRGAPSPGHPPAPPIPALAGRPPRALAGHHRRAAPADPGPVAAAARRRPAAVPAPLRPVLGGAPAPRAARYGRADRRAARRRAAAG